MLPNHQSTVWFQEIGPHSQFWQILEVQLLYTDPYSALNTTAYQEPPQAHRQVYADNISDNVLNDTAKMSSDWANIVISNYA